LVLCSVQIIDIPLIFFFFLLLSPLVAPFSGCDSNGTGKIVCGWEERKNPFFTKKHHSVLNEAHVEYVMKLVSFYEISPKNSLDYACYVK